MSDPKPALIPHSRPWLPQDYREVTDRLRPGWVADGPCTAEFERRAAAVLGWEEGACVNSGTSALHLALLALGVEEGDEVIIPAYVCCAVLNAVVMTGARAVAADCEPGGFNLDPESAAARLTSRTKAIIVAHLFGEPARSAELAALGPPLIEDCAQSFGAEQGEAAVGRTGALAVASFYATKVITTGVGGLVAGRAELLDRIRDLRQYDKRASWRLRYSYKLDELAAALGLWQLEQLPDMLARRQAIARQYQHEWGILLGEQRSIGARSLIYRYTLRDGRFDDRLFARLTDGGVQACRPVNPPLSRVTGEPCPEAELAYAETVSVPCYPDLRPAEVRRVREVVRGALERICG